MKFDFYQFCFTVIMFAALLLLVVGSLTDNTNALSTGGTMAFILFWAAFFRTHVF
jgi:hypothetical protein